MDSRSYRTKNALADSLKSLVETTKFDKISVEMICARADVTRRNFYRHFKDKYDLLVWIYNRDFSFDFDEHPDWNTMDYFPFFCQVMYDNQDFYRNAFKITGQNSLREFCYEWLYPLQQRTFADFFKEIEPIIPGHDLESTLLKAVTEPTYDSFVKWLSAEPCMPPDEFSSRFINFFDSFALFMYKTFHKENS